MVEAPWRVPGSEKRPVYCALLQLVCNRIVSPVAELILVYLEVQAERPSVFPFRMSEYYMLLRPRHRLPAFPVVVYLVPGPVRGRADAKDLY